MGYLPQVSASNHVASPTVAKTCYHDLCDSHTHGHPFTSAESVELILPMRICRARLQPYCNTLNPDDTLSAPNGPECPLSYPRYSHNLVIHNTEPPNLKPNEHAGGGLRAFRRFPNSHSHIHLILALPLP